MNYNDIAKIWVKSDRKSDINSYKSCDHLFYLQNTFVVYMHVYMVLILR